MIGIKNKSFLPCTPKGILSLLSEYHISISGKKVVIIGRSLIVGKPLALLLLQHNATVSICHSKTKDIYEYTKTADIIVTAVGKPQFFTRSLIHPNRNDQVLIDVGINRKEDGTLCGDMDYDQLKGHCSAITPVPGGVGPMTILSLAQNLLQAVALNT